MTTFKACRSCEQLVEFAPDPVLRFPHAAVIPMECPGGNAPRLCPMWTARITPTPGASPEETDRE